MGRFVLLLLALSVPAFVSANPQPMAVCCFSDGHCTVEEGEDACLRAGGFVVPRVEWTCEPNPCPAPGFGGCCRSDGTCETVEEATCVDEGGTWHGPSVFCYPDPCNPRACCLSVSCVVATYPVCHAQGGEWTDTECVPCNPCTSEYEEPSACCSGESCVIRFAYGCCLDGGTLQYVSTCAPCNPCVLNTHGRHACCIDSGAQCFMTAEFDCCGRGGMFYPTELCLPACPVPVDQLTWGRIKANYR